jgi:hypothetical protein
VQEVPQEGGPSGTYVSRMLRSILHKVYPAGDAPVPEVRRSDRVRARVA